MFPCEISYSCTDYFQEFVDIQHKLETEKRLLYFAEHGTVKKREGLRGDATLTEVPPRHEEL